MQCATAAVESVQRARHSVYSISMQCEVGAYFGVVLCAAQLD
jgi:hypothetical protein